MGAEILLYGGGYLKRILIAPFLRLNLKNDFMKKSKIILLIVFAAAALAVLYFAYGVARKRYFGAERQKTQVQKEEGQNQDQGADQNAGTAENAPAAESGRPNVENADCDSDCQKFKDNADNFKYCREVCGQTKIIPKSSEEECAALAGLEKDYCWRDLAVSKKDSSICKKISDAKLQSVCRNRVAEEILN